VDERKHYTYVRTIVFGSRGRPRIALDELKNRWGYPRPGSSPGFRTLHSRFPTSRNSRIAPAFRNLLLLSRPIDCFLHFVDDRGVLSSWKSI
jgi:hypothetical protein